MADVRIVQSLISQGQSQFVGEGFDVVGSRAFVPEEAVGADWSASLDPALMEEAERLVRGNPASFQRSIQALFRPRT